ncbi:butyrophilin subfamily 1 member A1-like [Ambystoma mexicanum]|uniref:butyrophilin subfamily 1 member A1-like n=1 Tax=Ambystoma mexicanum TaxID=8296 RepID=UPI0037E83A8B
MATGSQSLQLLFWLMVLDLQNSNSVKFSVLGPEFPVVATVGSDAILTCRLHPATSAQDLEVRWISASHNSIISLYRGGKEVNVSQIPVYQGRTQLVKDGLESGSVGLRIHGTQLSDEGVYRCFVQSETFNDQATLDLKVIGIGTVPNIHVESYQDGGIRLVCKSEGWYPEPEVLWRGHGIERLPLSSDHRNTPMPDGLFQIDSPLLVTGETSKDLSCAVRNLYTNQSKEAMISIAEPFFVKISPWTLGLSIILGICIVFSPLLVYTSSFKNAKFSLSNEVDFRRAVMKPEIVTLDPDTGNPELIVSPDLKSVTRSDVKQDLHDGPKRFSSARCVLGANSFASGCHYWEVLVESTGDWAVGCACESVTRKGLITLTPDDGIWSAGVTGGQYQVLANPRPPLYISRTPQMVGVYLEHERGRLSFYNVEEEMGLIYTFQVHFTEKLLPFFWVGSGVEIKIRH